MAKYNEWITDEGLLKIRGLVRRGLTDEQVEESLLKPMFGYKTTDIQYKMVKVDQELGHR